MQDSDVDANTYVQTSKTDWSTKLCLAEATQCRLLPYPPKPSPSLSAFCCCFIDPPAAFCLTSPHSQNHIQHSICLPGFLQLFCKLCCTQVEPSHPASTVQTVPVFRITKKGKKEMLKLSTVLPSIIQLESIHFCLLFAEGLVIHRMWMRLIKIQCSSTNNSLHYFLLMQEVGHDLTTLSPPVFSVSEQE